jgi:hypothetical protein
MMNKPPKDIHCASLKCVNVNAMNGGRCLCVCVGCCAARVKKNAEDRKRMEEQRAIDIIALNRRRWCDKCAEPAFFRFELHAITSSGLSPVNLANLCGPCAVNRGVIQPNNPEKEQNIIAIASTTTRRIRLVK